jgi:hypothetical protein
MVPDKELEAREAISYMITCASSDTSRPVNPLRIRFDALVTYAYDGIIKESCALLSQTWVV